MKTEFTPHDIEKRTRLLDSHFGNRHNALQIAKEMFG